MHFGTWAEHIGDLPDWYIDAICDEARMGGIRKAEANAAKEFLKHRRDHIDGLVLRNKHLLPLVTKFGIVL